MIKPNSRSFTIRGYCQAGLSQAKLGFKIMNSTPRFLDIFILCALILAMSVGFTKFVLFILERVK